MVKKTKNERKKTVYNGDTFAPVVRESVRHFIYSRAEKDYSSIDASLSKTLYPQVEELEKELKEKGPMSEEEADKRVAELLKSAKAVKDNPELNEDIELMANTIIRSYATGDREGYEFMRARLQKAKDEQPVMSSGFAA